MNDNLLLMINGYVQVPSAEPVEPQIQAVGTVVSNMAYYGFAPSGAVLRALLALDADALATFNTVFTATAREATGADRNMEAFVVYKNFPTEVLAMSEAEYWLKQILMYVGLPNEWFTEDEAPRAPIAEVAKLKIIDLASEATIPAIFANLSRLPSRWTDQQRESAVHVLNKGDVAVDIDAFGFRENAVEAAKVAFTNGVAVKASNATDVLRLAAALSDGDVSLRTAVKFKAFSRPERRALVLLLEGCRYLIEDFGLRPEPWKRLLSRLRPGAFAAPRVSAAYDLLYNGRYETVAGKIDRAIAAKDHAILEILKAQPGNYMRRLHKLYAVFGREALDGFITVLPNLTTAQLLKIEGYLRTINDRDGLIYPPRGNWSRAQFVPNKKVKIAPGALFDLRSAISLEIGDRLNARFPDGFRVDAAADNVKLQTNDQELAPYGRGTVFDIPEEVDFIRSASFWQHPSSGNIWFDNGWNFFNENWSEKSAICWNKTYVSGHAAVFSGDPTNSKDLKGRGCQMIDLYPSKLVKLGVRYAVWSILCFSHKAFNEAEDVLATLQWGKDAQSGKLYEPSRAQMVFPLKGANLTKFVAYIDLLERKLVYLDANLRADVSSAAENGKVLSTAMPSLVEYLRTLPSVGDLFFQAKEGTIPVVYSDAEVPIDGPAYVFRRENEGNRVDPIDLSSILADAGATA